MSGGPEPISLLICIQVLTLCGASYENVLLNEKPFQITRV